MNDSIKQTVSYFGHASSNWIDLEFQSSAPANLENRSDLTAAAKSALNDILVSSLNMQHIIVLAGSGASLGKASGPTMWKLWCYCVYSAPDEDEAKLQLTDEAKNVIYTIKFAYDEKNIEALLSRCEAYLQIHNDKYVSGFVTAAKKTILALCSDFIKADNNDQLSAHQKFLRRMSRRRARDSRLKVFTTNYDLCFEIAASRQGLVVIDGFSFSQPRIFDPKFFAYDIVRRSNTGDDVGMPLEGVFHLCKLHGSVNWSRNQSREISVKVGPRLQCAYQACTAEGSWFACSSA